MAPRALYPSQGDEEMQTPEKLEFEKLLQQYDYAFKRGEIVHGTIIALESNGALVDIGAKTAALLPNKEIASPYTTAQQSLKPGEAHDFYILFEEDEDGQLTLSLRRVQTAQNWNKLEELMNADTVVTCKVTAVVKGGLLVDVMGLRGFIPSSHLRVKQTLEELVGQELPAKIINLDRQRNNIILSHRKMIAEQMAEQRKDLFAKLHEGAVVEGEVVRLTDFGAFVDLGGVDGLLPLSQMSWRWVEHPSDILSIGDVIQVEVIGIDHEKQRVSLSIKGQHADPWNEVTKELGYGDEVQGTVTRMKHFGAFVEVYPGVEALLPSKDITEYETRNGTKVEVGQSIKTFIVKFSPDERRISLSFHAPGDSEGPRFRDRLPASAE
ncbi:MAG TPA: S1 RNA-binding domain-containing protein [Coleofasciculaceae cyanobacterium]